MVKSKEWNWATVTDEIWNEPSEDSYYYLHRWMEKKFERFLDLGCGLGRHSILFAKNGFLTDSIDLSPYAVEQLTQKAKEQNLSIKAEVGDIHNLPYEDNRLDCLLAYHVISHTDSEGIIKVISEIRRVLRSGGEFYITLCSKSSPNFTQSKYPKIDENTVIKTEEPEIGIPHYYADLQDIHRLLREFLIFRIRHIEDFFKNTSSRHYYIHGGKP